MKKLTLAGLALLAGLGCAYAKDKPLEVRDEQGNLMSYTTKEADSTLQKTLSECQERPKDPRYIYALKRELATTYGLPGEFIVE